MRNKLHVTAKKGLQYWSQFPNLRFQRDETKSSDAITDLTAHATSNAKLKIMKMETDLITEDFDLAIAAVADRRRVAGIVEGVDLQVQRQALREEIN